MALSIDEEEVVVALVLILTNVKIFLFLLMVMYNEPSQHRARLSVSQRNGYSLIERAHDQRKHMVELVGLSDITALDALRMSRDTFKRLCYVLEHRGGGGLDHK